MKTKLHKTLLVGAFALMGTQVSQAQYFGSPFGGTATQIGTTTTVGAKYRMELENFDSLAAFTDGVNTGGNLAADSFGTYWDKSTANAETGQPGNNSGDNVAGTYRPDGDVDIVEITYDDSTTGNVLTGNQGGEYTLQTIEVVNSGTYHLNLNFKSFGSGKRYQVILIDPTTQTSVGVLFNASSADTADGTLVSTNIPDDGGYIYRDSQDSQPFVLQAGTWVIQARTLDGGPTFDYIDFTFDSASTTASVDDAQLLGSKLSAYPNPSTGGVFTLNIESKWEVYNVLGAKMIKGEGTNVDLSRFAKGVYLLKTPYATKTLITE
jgi:hypothetical protein